MKKSKLVNMISFAIGGALIGIGIVILLTKSTLGGITGMDFLVFGIGAILAGPGIYDSIEQKKIKKIEERFPDFLRDVAEAGRFGMTLAEAIVVASSGKYGALTDEIKKMAAKIQWGVPVKEALLSFNERVNTPLINRMIAIIIKANEAGGNVADVLGMVSHAARETQLMKKERAIEMSTYSFVLLTAFGVFVATIFILNSSFLPQMGKAGRAVAESLKNSAVTNVPVQIAYEDIPTIKFLFVMATLIHGVGDGIMIGLLKDGRIKSGLIWAFVLLVGGYIALKVMNAA